MDDGTAFRTFLHDEMKVVTGNIENLNLMYRGKMRPLQDILYKFVRCELAHEGTMPPDFVVERGQQLRIEITDSTVRFSDGLLEGLARAVIHAPENADEFADTLKRTET